MCPILCLKVPICSFSSLSGGPVLTQSYPQMQVQQLLQMKKQAAAVQAAAAAQQKAGQPQQGQATVQQKVNTPHQQTLSRVNN